MSHHLKIGLAQIDSRLGSVGANLEHHLEWIDRARADGVELLLFPELSLTGYRLLHLTPRVAMELEGSDVLERLAERAGDMAVVVGMVEKGPRERLYNSAVLLHAGKVQAVHRKLYLPTYGIFQEGRFFSAGNELELIELFGTRLGLLICEDLWHPHLAKDLALAGAKVLLVVSAGPGRIGSGELPESQEVWETLTRATALTDTMWVAYCNRTGWEEGSFYTGGSHVVRPGGKLEARAAFLDEDLLVSELDLDEVDRLRWRLPLLADQRTDIRGPGD